MAAMVGVGQPTAVWHLVVADSTTPNLWDNLLSAVTDHPGRAVLTLVTVLIALVAGPVLARLVNRVPVVLETRGAAHGGRMAERLLRVEKTGMSRWLGRITLLCVWLAAAVTIGLIWFSDQTLAPLLKDQHTSLGSLLGGLALQAGESLIVVACTLAIARALYTAIVKHESKINPNLIVLGARVVYVATLAVGLVVILAIWGTGIALPVALLGALTVALSLALQDVLKNLVAGIYLLVEHPFSIGDRIALAPYTGKVEDIKIRYTSLRTADGQQVLIPNSMLFSLPVVNLSTNDGRRAGLLVTVAAGGGGAEGFDQAEADILRALEGVPAILYKPEPPRVTLNKATAAAIELQAIFWLGTSNPAEQANALSEAIERVRAQVAGAEVALLASATAAPV
jgi:small conductance mechanosensitive channel